MTEAERLQNRIEIFQTALEEIASIAMGSEGPGAFFYGLLAQQALKRGEE